MESKNGYIYVLINPSLNGIVKIGRTSRNPNDRVQELSSATGIPTPFILVYQRYFSDSHLAEKVIHTLLEDNGYRVASNREFFTIPVHEAIDIIQHLTDVSDSHGTIERGQEISFHSSDVASDYYLEASKYYLGSEGYFENKAKALELYHKALELGCKQAATQIGFYYELGLGVKADEAKAIHYYHIGGEEGDIDAYLALSGIYSFSSKNFNSHNAQKCWDIIVANISRIDSYKIIVDALYKYALFCAQNVIFPKNARIFSAYNKMLSHYMNENRTRLKNDEMHKVKDFLNKVQVMRQSQKGNG